MGLPLRHPAASRGGRRLAGALAALLAAGAAAPAFLWVRDAPVFAVRDVTVTGLEGPQADEVRAALTDAARDMTTLNVRDEELRRAADRFPVVRDVRADADPPRTLRVTVDAFAPVAVVQDGGRRVAAAADGTLLEGAPAAGLPEVTTEVPVGEERLGDRGALAVVRLLGAAPEALRARAARAGAGGGGLVVVLRDGPRLRFGGPERLAAKWAAAARVLADPSSQGAEYLDLRLPERPVAGRLPPRTAQPSTSP
jgi:cell division septal protein FtsQ